MSGGRTEEPSLAALLARVPDLARTLLDWYRRAHRDLPWRHTHDPYALWVSEVMLQQTQVSTVLSFYERFLLRYPDLESLAATDEEALLKAWEGLGYYGRAKRMHLAAKAILQRGGWPRRAVELQGLPGIGRSTAGAIASFAFGEAAPILDGNVRRIWARLLALDRPASGQVLSGLWGLSGAAVQSADPALVNQALMELGATVCRPRNPLCGACPLLSWCEAALSGEPERFPPRAPRHARPLLEVSLGIIWRGGRFLVTKRAPDGFLGGLWELPGGKWQEGETAPEALRRELREELALEVFHLRPHPAVRHGYSHFEVRLHPFECEAADDAEPQTSLPHRWILSEEIGTLAFPAGTHKVFSKIFPIRRRAAESAGHYGTQDGP